MTTIGDIIEKISTISIALVVAGATALGSVIMVSHQVLNYSETTDELQILVKDIDGKVRNIEGRLESINGSLKTYIEVSSRAMLVEKRHNDLPVVKSN